MEYAEGQDYDSQAICTRDAGQLPHGIDLAGIGDGAGSGEEGNASGSLLADTGVSPVNEASEARPKTAEEVDWQGLESITLAEVAYLPRVAGVYFLAHAVNGLLYIGQSGNIRARWKTHNLLEEFQIDTHSTARQFELRWIEVIDEKQRALLEEDLIRKYSPPRNRTFSPNYSPAVRDKPILTRPVMKKTRTRIREVAARRGITTAYQLQKAARLHPSMAARLYKDNAKGASWSTLDLVCDALECEISDILVREDDSQPVKQ